MEPGIYPNMPEAAYHADPDSVSKSMLWTLLTKSPAHLRYGVRTETASMKLGTVVHTATLEPDSFTSRFVRIPDDAPKYPTAAQWGAKKPSEDSLSAMGWWRDFEAANAGRERVKAEDWAAALAISANLRADRTLAKAFAIPGAMAEASCFWRDEMTGELCRCRPDWTVPGVIMLDLKSTADASSVHALTSSIIKYGYHMQQSSYLHGWKVLTGEDLPWLFCFVETEPPYAHRLVELDYQFVKLGGDLYRRALERYAQCKASGLWPSYPTSIQQIEPPAWLLRENEIPNEYGAMS